MSFLRRFPGRGRVELSPDRLADRRAVLEQRSYELVPMKGVEQAVAALPPSSAVTITCSPVKGIDATMDLTGELAALGHRATPHLAARMVQSADHLDRVVGRLEALELSEVFVIAGDRAEPLGPYADAPTLIEALLEKAPFLSHVGFASYPDGHAFIDADALHAALHRKQSLLVDAGVSGHASTQMCFDADAIRHWLTTERAAGFDLPVRLGVPGVVDRAKLVRTGMRLGVGASLRYVAKNRGALSRLMTSSSFEPGDVVDGLAGDLAALGVDGVHLYTFNQVAPTAEWMAAQA